MSEDQKQPGPEPVKLPPITSSGGGVIGQPPQPKPEEKPDGQ